jgi:CRP-like cAMP-binding protein
MTTSDRELLEALSLVPWLKSLPDSLLEPLCRATKRVQLQDQEQLARRGQSLTHLVIVTNGRLSLNLISSAGKRHVLGQVGRGQVFGIIPLMEQSVGIYNVDSLGSSEVVMLAGDAFLYAVSQHPPLSMAVIKLMCARSRRLQEFLAARNLHPIQMQLARLLLDMSQLYGFTSSDLDRTVELHLTHSDLADMLGISRQSLHQDIKKLEALGLLELSYSEVRIPDITRLEQWLEKQVCEKYPFK